LIAFIWLKDCRNSLTCSSHYFSHSLISRWRVSYLHTCNPLASSAYYIYETIVSDRPSTNEKIEARREEVASRLNSSDHDYLLISTSFAGIFWHSSFSFYKYNIALRDERDRERGRYATEDTRARAYRCACASLSNGWQKHVLSHWEHNARSCTQVPRGGHADAASNRKSRPDVYCDEVSVIAQLLGPAKEKN